MALGKTWQETALALGYTPEEIAEEIADDERRMAEAEEEAQEWDEIAEGLERMLTYVLNEKSPEQRGAIIESLGFPDTELSDHENELSSDH